MTSSADSASRRILGIDPGLRVTGFGVIVATRGTRCSYVVERLHPQQPEAICPNGCKIILRDLGSVIDRERPTEVAVEKVFVNVNPQSTLLLGQARGAAIAAAVLAELPVSEYTALQVKQAVVGHGKAAKEQVQEMVQAAACAARRALRRRGRRARLRDLPCARRRGHGRPAPDRVSRAARPHL